MTAAIATPMNLPATRTLPVPAQRRALTPVRSGATDPHLHADTGTETGTRVGSTRVRQPLSDWLEYLGGRGWELHMEAEGSAVLTRGHLVQSVYPCTRPHLY